MQRRHPTKDGRDAIDKLKAIGWSVDDDTKGYFKLRCPCGNHLAWLHLTPSNPNYFKERIAHCRRTCSNPSSPVEGAGPGTPGHK